MRISDAQKGVLDDATNRLLLNAWKVFESSFTDQQLKEVWGKLPQSQQPANENDYKFLDVDFFLRLVQNAYCVAEVPEALLIKNLTNWCEAMYEKWDHEAPLYASIIGLRRIWEGDQNYLRSNNVQLHTIEAPLPTCEAIRNLLEPKMVLITNALLDARKNTDCNVEAKVKYVEGVLNRDYILDALFDPIEYIRK